jgi:PKHD-type hydroxylase
VTKGERCVAVTWIQSMIKDNESRTMLRQLKDVMKSFDQKNAAKEAVKLQQVYSNLYRLCAD